MDTKIEYKSKKFVRYHYNLLTISNMVGVEIPDKVFNNIKKSLIQTNISNKGSEKHDYENNPFPIDLENKTILIAEDEELNFVYLAMALKKTKAKIIHAKNGKEAIEMVKKYPNIDIILMDIRMPEMNGKDATKVIKTINEDIVIIAQTAFVQDDDEYSCFEVGCDDYLAKPISQKRLFETLLKYL